MVYCSESMRVQWQCKPVQIKEVPGLHEVLLVLRHELLGQSKVALVLGLGVVLLCQVMLLQI